MTAGDAEWMADRIERAETVLGGTSTASALLDPMPRGQLTALAVILATVVAVNPDAFDMLIAYAEATGNSQFADALRLTVVAANGYLTGGAS